MLRNLSLLTLIAVSACSTVPAAVSPQPIPDSTADIGADELRRDLFAFAADSMRGRETGTEDATRAAQFLASRVQRLGLEPAGDSLYLQRVPLQRVSLIAASRIAVEERGRETPLRIGVDVVPLMNLGVGIPAPRRSAQGNIVFAGYGRALAKPNRDDLAGLDLEDQVVVLINGAPPSSDSGTRAAMEAPEAISDRLARILPQRPAAVIVLLTGKSTDLFDQVVPMVNGGVSPPGASSETPDTQRPIPMILLGTPRVGSPLLPSGWPTDDRPQVLKGRRLVARVQERRVPFTAYNVVAVVRGRDPVLSRTYVAFGAHYDHIGIVSPPVLGDSIANGADDDGSGTVSLLAIARAMQRATEKPKRSTIFVWHVGEEQGLLGSSYFVDHATVPIDSIVAQFNADMIGRNAAALLYTVGPRAAPNALSRRLGAIVDSVNAAQPTPFVINRDFDSPTHPEHIFERSDHFNYARKGIPIVFYTTGLHDDYHKPSDEPSKIDYEKLARVARLMRDAGLAVANSVSRPRE